MGVYTVSVRFLRYLQMKFTNQDLQHLDAFPTELIQTIARQVEKEDEYGFCVHCNCSWNPSFPHCHIDHMHGKYQCARVYIQLKYEFEDTEEGDYRHRNHNPTEPWTEVCI